MRGGGGPGGRDLVQPTLWACRTLRARTDFDRLFQTDVPAARKARLVGCRRYEILSDSVFDEFV